MSFECAGCHEYKAGVGLDGPQYCDDCRRQRAGGQTYATPTCPQWSSASESRRPPYWRLHVTCSASVTVERSIRVRTPRWLARASQRSR